MEFLTIQNNQMIFETQKYFDHFFDEKLDATFYEACKTQVLGALPDEMAARKKLAIYGQVHRELTNLALQGFGKHARTLSVDLPH